MPKKTEPKDTQSTQPEQVQQVRISDIHPFKNHPFKVVDDALMQETVDSIMQFGVLNPTIIRPDPGGGYEMVAGHRRLHASGLAGKDTIPAIVRNLTDDEAVILLVDTNLQRENISPMERAQAYKMKMEALKHQGQRTDLTLVQVGPKLNSAEKIAQDSGESVSQVKRLIRLTELVPEIQQKVDAKEIALNPAVELSYLKPEEQRQFLDAMEYSQNTPSLSQAQRLKKLSREGKCTQDAMYKVMSEEKKDELDRVTLKSDTLRKYFPKNYTPQQMERVIIKLLDQWQKNGSTRTNVERSSEKGWPSSAEEGAKTMHSFMSPGKRIRSFRLKRGMTQRALGIAVGFPVKTADIRIAQYESGARTPKHDLLCILAQTLEVPVSALEIPYIKSRDKLEQLLQALEDEYGLTVTITEPRD